MIKLKLLLIEQVKLLDNGDLQIPSVEDFTPEQLEKISTLMRQKGYDSRGAIDAKRALTRFLTNPHNPFKDVIDGELYKTWIDSISIVLHLKGGKPKLQPTLSYSPAKIIRDAKRHFRTTNSLNLAGYILPDGSLLNLSGRMGHSRDLDHREIATIFLKNNVKIESDEGSATPYMREFMDNCKAIRLGGSQNTADMANLPTKQQAEQLLRFFSMYNGDIRLDVRDKKFGRDGRTYGAGTPPKIILRDIIAFYKNGEFPPEILKYSQSMKEPVFEAKELDDLIRQNQYD